MTLRIAPTFIRLSSPAGLSERFVCVVVLLVQQPYGEEAVARADHPSALYDQIASAVEIGEGGHHVRPHRRPVGLDEEDAALAQTISTFPAGPVGARGGEVRRDAGVAGQQTFLARGVPGARFAGALQQARLLIFAVVAEVSVDGDQVALGEVNAMKEAAARADPPRLRARRHLMIVLALLCVCAIAQADL